MTRATDIRDTFFQECEELLEALNDGLLQIAEAVPDAPPECEQVNAVFRAVHSIKGGAGAFGLDGLVRFAHRFETTLDALRSGSLDADEGLVELFQRSADHLCDLVAAARDDLVPDTRPGEDLATRLAAVLGQSADQDTSAADAVDFGFVPLALPFTFNPDPVHPAGLADAASYAMRYRIVFKPSRALFRNGHDPAILFSALTEIGRLSSVVDCARLPSLARLEPTEAYFGWSLELETDEPEHVVHEIFEFVDGLCDLQIEPLVMTGARQLSMRPDTVGEGADADPKHIGVKAETGATASHMPIAAASADAIRPVARKMPSGPRATVRVDLDLVDRLINLVGELVINQSVLSQRVHEAGISPRSDIGNGLDEFRNLARDIQESVMAIRAQSVKPLFQRMARIVREASDISGKKARLETSGEMTEVDKTVIERLSDPLTHMIRNAVDHGLESVEARGAAGKSEVGVITLSAAHRSGRVIIEVSDDGAGIDRSRVRQIAVDKGLIPADLELPDGEIDKLLFMPGFSTASSVSDLSGRGVGMDVVKSAISALGGRVSIQSVPGQGTTFSISLPLTLAVLDGMVVDVAGQTMVVPITAIVETLRPPSQDIHALGDGAQVVSVRGSFVPVVDLGAVFGHREPQCEFSDRVLLLVECEDDTRCALAVDAIYDQRQVVIKGLEINYGHVPGVAAATILGDGKIALIIDPEETAAHAVPFAARLDRPELV